MNWISVKDKMPAEKEFVSSGRNFYDGKDRMWTESDEVLVVNDRGHYFIDSTRNGQFRSERSKDCDGFTHYVLAWMPIPKYDKLEF